MNKTVTSFTTLLEISNGFLHRAYRTKQQFIKSGRFELLLSNYDQKKLIANISNHYYQLSTQIQILKIEYPHSISYFLSYSDGFIILSFDRNTSNLLNLEEYIKWNCKIIERQHIIHNYDIKIKLELHWPNYDKAQIIKGTYLEKIYYKTAEILKNGIVHIKNRINKQEQVKRNKQYMYNQNRIYKNMSSQYQRDEYYEQQRKSEILTKLINKNKTCTKIDKYQYKSKSIWIKQQQ